jgi:hypothetical protein
MPNHLGDINRIVATIFRTVVVYVASVFLAFRRPSQPRTPRKILTGCRIHPDFLTLDITKNVGSMDFPPVDFIRGRGQTAVARRLATLTARVAALHQAGPSSIVAAVA